jgi:lysophospholipase L1-like esterase
MHAILCFGDSITFGIGEQPAKGWCGRLKDFLEKKDPYNYVYNLGIPGDTSQGVLERIDVECKRRIRYKRERDKATIIIAIGTNDIKFKDGLHQISEDDFESNIKCIIEVAKKYTSNIFVLQMPPVHSTRARSWEGNDYKNSDIDRRNNILKRISGEYYVSLNFEDWDEKLPDGLHSNTEGYDEMFAQIKRAIL